MKKKYFNNIDFSIFKILFLLKINNMEFLIIIIFKK